MLAAAGIAGWGGTVFSARPDLPGGVQKPGAIGATAKLQQGLGKRGHASRRRSTPAYPATAPPQSM